MFVSPLVRLVLAWGRTEWCQRSLLNVYFDLIQQQMRWVLWSRRANGHIFCETHTSPRRRTHTITSNTCEHTNTSRVTAVDVCGSPLERAGGRAASLVAFRWDSHLHTWAENELAASTSWTSSAFLPLKHTPRLSPEAKHISADVPRARRKTQMLEMSGTRLFMPNKGCRRSARAPANRYPPGVFGKRSLSRSIRRPAVNMTPVMEIRLAPWHIRQSDSQQDHVTHESIHPDITWQLLKRRGISPDSSYIRSV